MSEDSGLLVFGPGGAAHGESLMVAEDGPQIAAVRLGGGYVQRARRRRPEGRAVRVVAHREVLRVVPQRLPPAATAVPAPTAPTAPTATRAIAPVMAWSLRKPCIRAPLCGKWLNRRHCGDQRT
jgi:hypothetical protein